MAGRRQIRGQLSREALIRGIRERVEAIPDPGPSDSKIPLADAVMSAFAMFALKDPSLLAFDGRRKDAVVEANLKTAFHIDRVPCDTQMRTILDPLDPETLRPLFTDVLRPVQRGKLLEQFQFLGQYYLLALDGTGYFSSTKIGCNECLEKTSSSGEVTYSHQMLGAAIVHPDLKVVLPLMPEPIIKQDGQQKNDCERNAAKRFLAQLRKDHPHLEFVVVEDALSSNAPHIEELQRHNLRFLLGVKEGDHAFLFAEVQRRLEEDDRVTFVEVHRAGVTYLYWIMCDVPLNASNPDLLVTFVDYTEVRDDRTLHFSWVTDLPATKDNVPEVVRGGRSRWKIENETFNTLKNQGYHFEHNFGHGRQHLSVVFAMLMMLAFLVDQVQQLCCPLFEAALARAASRRALWEAQRRLFFEFRIQSLRQLWEALAYGHEPCTLKVLDSS